MPHTPSAAKRLRKSEKRRRHNRVVAKGLKGKRKELEVALVGKDAAKTTETIRAVQATGANWRHGRVARADRRCHRLRHR